jgi:hypothetical protein
MHRNNSECIFLNVKSARSEIFRNLALLLVYWISRASIFPRSSLLGAGQLGLWKWEGGWVNWVKGYKRGQFTSNLRGRRINPVTSGGSQPSGRGHKGELARGARGARGNAPCIYVNVMCVPE